VNENAELVFIVDEKVEFHYRYMAKTIESKDELVMVDTYLGLNKMPWKLQGIHENLSLC